MAIFNFFSFCLVIILAPIIAIAYLIALLGISFLLFTSYIFDRGEKKYFKLIEKIIMPFGRWLNRGTADNLNKSNDD